jgi:hypothetical protein
LTLESAPSAVEPNTEDSGENADDERRLLVGETLVTHQPEHLAVSMGKLRQRFLHVGPLAGRVDLLLDARHVVGGEVPLTSVPAGERARPALTSDHPHPLAMGNTEDPGRGATAPGVEATTVLQHRQKGHGDEISDVGRIAASAGRVAEHQVPVTAEDQLQGRWVRSEPSQ